MPDSDNTTTRSLVTRRTILGKGTIAIAAIVHSPRRALGHDASAVGMSSDPAVVLWRKWRELHQRTEQLCRWQQQLEQKLAETVGFPRVPGQSDLSESEMAQPFRIGHEILHRGEKDVAPRGNAETDLIAHQTRWETADEEIGYSAALLQRSDSTRPTQLPTGAVHGALDRQNVFFLGDEVSGIINFRLRHDDVLVSEIADVLVGWVSQPNGELDQHKTSAILCGYESVRTLTDAEKAALPGFVLASTARRHASDPKKAVSPEPPYWHMYHCSRE